MSYVVLQYSPFGLHYDLCYSTIYVVLKYNPCCATVQRILCYSKTYVIVVPVLQYNPLVVGSPAKMADRASLVRSELNSS